MSSATPPKNKFLELKNKPRQRKRRSADSTGLALQGDINTPTKVKQRPLLTTPRCFPQLVPFFKTAASLHAGTACSLVSALPLLRLSKVSPGYGEQARICFSAL